MKRKTTMISVVVVLSSVVAVSVAAARSTAGDLRGAGSSFVFPLVSQWKEHYSKAAISYNPIGSGAGIQAISNRSVDFGASDAPLTPDQFSGCHGCVQVPWALSATSIMYNLSGVKNNLHMTGPVLANIYLGKVTKWNDKRIRALNPGVSLPGTRITPIFRSDGSGTTYNFTDYLSKVSPTFKRKVGVGTQVNFSTGVGGRGSSGVSAVLKQTQGGIAYADIAYALKNHFQFFNVKNRAGKFAGPGLVGIKSAAATVKKVPKSNEMHIVDPPKSQKRAYPICTFTYVILPLKTSKASDLKTFAAWAMTTGQTFGPKLKFYPIPKVVRKAGLKTLKRVKS